jgi:hypothetical protein
MCRPPTPKEQFVALKKQGVVLFRKVGALVLNVYFDRAVFSSVDPQYVFVLYTAFQHDGRLLMDIVMCFPHAVGLGKFAHILSNKHVFAS